jgi:hypothetical protein
MPTVKIVRSSEYINRLRDYGIYIDGRKVGVVSNGEVVEFVVSSGEHTIYARIDWCFSPTRTFSIADHEFKAFHVGGFKGAKWLMPLGFALLILYYVLTYLFKMDSLLLFILVLPVFFVLMYFISIGRKKYLTLEPENKHSLKQCAATNMVLMK